MCCVCMMLSISFCYSALPKIIKTGFSAINLIYFFTAGPDEVFIFNAWLFLNIYFWYFSCPFYDPCLGFIAVPPNNVVSKVRTPFSP